jgi:hypothetical protein
MTKLKELYQFHLEDEDKFSTKIPTKWLQFLTQNTQELDDIEIELSELLPLCTSKDESKKALQWIKEHGENWGLSIKKDVKLNILRLEKTHLEKLIQYLNFSEFLKNPI